MKTLVHLLVGDKRGGCERDALMVCKYAKAWRHVVVILTEPGEMTADFEQSGAKVLHLHLWPKNWAAVVVAVERTMLEVKPDAVISWHGMVLLPQYRYALRKLAVPIIVHGGNPAYSLPWWVDIRYLAVGALLPGAGLPSYFCCSEHVARSFDQSWYLKRFPRRVIQNGVEIPTMLHTPREIGLQTRFVVGMLARLDAIKDHATLLRSFQTVSARWPNAILEILGDGPLRDDLERLGRQLGVSSSVRWLGSQRDIYDVMRQWDIFAYATTNQEGLGNALIEAMMLGLPCVATDVAPIREVAGDVDAVELVPLEDDEAFARVITELVQDMSRRRQICELGRERAQREFHPRVFADRVTGLLDELTTPRHAGNA